MFLLLLGVLVALVSLFFYLRRKEHEQFWKHVNSIPGPKAYPIVGTEYFFMNSCEQVFERDRQLAKQFYPIYRTVAFGMGMANIMHPEDIELVLSSAKHIEKTNFDALLMDWLGHGLLTNTGKNWHKRRKILTPAFHFKILQEFVEVFNKEINLVVEGITKECFKPSIDIMKYLTEYTLNSIGETSLGIDFRKDDRYDEYKQAVSEYEENYIYRLVRPWLHIPFIYNLSSASKKNQKNVDTLHNFSSSAVKERSKLIEENGQDHYTEGKRLGLLDLMIKYKLSGAEIDDVGIREEVDTFVLGGHDTTSVSLSHTLMVLANEPDIQEEMYQELVSVVENPASPSFTELGELKYMERCIKESLRKYPSAPSIGRIAGEDIKTKTGHIIPKGCDIIIFIYDLHHSPEIWENPEKFDPDRFLQKNVAARHPYAFIPFSAGNRNCIGQKYAMLKMKSAICGILRSFKLEPVTKPDEIVYKAGIVLRPSNSIKVKFVPRN